jgi:putative transposase
VLSRLFRRLFLKALSIAHAAGRLSFFGDHAHLADAQSFADFLVPLRKAEWVVYAKRPFGRPEAVLAYLSRYTHRVAIANSRLIAVDEGGVTFKWKDYRIEGRDRYKHRRVHPPLPHSRPAKGLAPHPPLRPVRQKCLCRQHRTRA